MFCTSRTALTAPSGCLRHPVSHTHLHRAPCAPRTPLHVSLAHSSMIYSPTSGHETSTEGAGLTHQLAPVQAMISPLGAFSFTFTLCRFKGGTLEGRPGPGCRYGCASVRACACPSSGFASVVSPNIHHHEQVRDMGRKGKGS